jgi:hypothetical protein
VKLGEHLTKLPELEQRNEEGVVVKPRAGKKAQYEG